MREAASILAARRERLVGLLTRRALLGLFAFATLAAVSVSCAWWSLAAAADAAFAREPFPFLVFLAAGCLMTSLGLRLLVALATAGAMPQGVRLPAFAAGALHDQIAAMSARFGGVRIDSVWITADMNAAVLQRPRWGLAGPMQTHLLIGLPLTHSVSPRQLSAVLAHEFGHLTVQRIGGAAWARHLFAWWFRVSDALAEQWPCCAALIDRWTRPEVHWAVELSHVDEFEADAEAARMVGAETVADALVELALKERFLCQDYWCKVLQQSEVRSKPLIRPYRDMALGMTTGFKAPASASLVMSCLCDASADDDGGRMHPTVRERLEALGMPGECLSMPRGAEETAASRLLKPLLPSLSLAFDQAWWLGTRETWMRSHRRALMRQRAGIPLVP